MRAPGSFVVVSLLLSVLNVDVASGFSLPQSKSQLKTRFSFKSKSSTTSSSSLFGIRCENKYYQLEEMEDKENSTTELFLKEDGSIIIGETDGPLWSSADGTWQVKPGTDDFVMTIHKKFSAGSKGRDMGEFDFTVSRTYEGDMTLVGESVAITGVMKNGILGQAQDVGFFNMIDGTDVRLDARSDARAGGEKDPNLVDAKNDASSTHKGAQGYLVGQPSGSNTNDDKLPFGWEEHWDPGQGKHYYVNSSSGTTQWEKPTQKSLQDSLADPGFAAGGRTSHSHVALPFGWEEHFDPEQGRNFYVDTTTGLSQWDRPTQQQTTSFGQSTQVQPQTQAQPAQTQTSNALPAGWEELFDAASQKPYYVDRARGYSQWERPQ